MSVTVLPETLDPTQCNATTVMEHMPGRTYSCINYPGHTGEHRWWIDMAHLIDPDCAEEDVHGWHIVGADSDHLCIHEPEAWAATVASRIEVRLNSMAIGARRPPELAQEALW